MLGPDSAPDAPQLPVFVDDTGRRHRWLRLSGWVVGGLAAAYLALFVVSLTTAPGVLPLSLPGVGRLLPNASAPDIPVRGHGKQRPGQVVTTSTPAPAATAPAATPRPTPDNTPTLTTSRRPTARPTPTRSAGRTNAPSPRPTTPTPRGSPKAHPTSSPRGTGRPTAHPTHSPHR